MDLGRHGRREPGGRTGVGADGAAVLMGGIDSGLGAFPENGAFELREGPHHLHHRPASRSRRVDRLGQATESRSGFLELLHDREHVAERARSPIQLPDNDRDVAGGLAHPFDCPRSIEGRGTGRTMHRLQTYEYTSAITST